MLLNRPVVLTSWNLFGTENKDNNIDIEKCPDQELAEVSDKILNKCGGVPLAIITLSSLLACKARNKLEWYEVYNSVGTGMENNMDVKNMRNFLSFSYYELPCHLRTCLLYLSMFPKDFKIGMDRLIINVDSWRFYPMWKIWEESIWTRRELLQRAHKQKYDPTDTHLWHAI